jgi:hypothetical protein
MKLIAGQMNALYIICKPGYAEGVNKPKRAVKAEVKPVSIKIRRNKRLVA